MRSQVGTIDDEEIESSKSQLVSHFFSVYHTIVHSATAKPTNSSDTTAASSSTTTATTVFQQPSIYHTFVEVEKEQTLLEQRQSHLVSRRDALFQQVEELNELVKKIQEKKLELQYELEIISQKESDVHADLERVKMRTDIMKRSSSPANSPRSARGFGGSPQDDSPRKPSLPIFLASGELMNNMFRLHSFTFNNSKKEKDTSDHTLIHVKPEAEITLDKKKKVGDRFNARSKQTFDILSVNILPSEKIISGSSDGFVRIWNIGSNNTTVPEYQVHAHKGWVRCLASSAEGDFIATGGGDNTIHLYSLFPSVDLNNSKDEDDFTTNYIDNIDDGLMCKRAFYGHKAGITCVQVDEKYVVSGSVDKTIKLWDVETGSNISTLTGHRSYVKALQYYACGLATGGGEEPEIKIWDTRMGRTIRRYYGHDGGVNAVRFDSTRLVSGGRCDGTVKVFDLRMGSLLDTIYVGSCNTTTNQAQTGNGSNIPMHRRNSIHNINIAYSPRAVPPRPRSVSQIEAMTPTNPSVTSLQFVGDNLIFAAKGLAGPVLYDMKLRTPARQFIGHTSHVNCLDFSNDCLATASRDLTVKVWKL